MSGHALDPNSPLPRYYQIYNVYLSMIESGELSAGQSLPPERHIAESFGVSRPTVVKALDLLAREKRIEKQQGRGNIILKAKQNTENKTIAFVSSHNMADELLMGISQKAFASHYHLQILGMDCNFKHLDSYLNTCLENGIQGFLIYGRPNNSDAKSYQKLLDQNIPLVMVDRYYPELNCDYVVYDNETASYELCKQLLARGHQSIAVLPGREINSSSVKDRLKGYKKALEEANLAFNEELLWLDIYEHNVPARHLKISETQKLERKLEQYKPTAILTINDLLANYLVHDLMLIQDSFMRSALNGIVDSSSSFIDLELASFGTQAISSFNYLKVFAVHPTFELGRAAADLLISRLNGSISSEIKHLTMPMQIVECSDETKSLMYGGGR